MIRILSYKPDVFKDAEANDPVYIEGFDVKGVYGYILLAFHDDKCIVHLAVERWSVNALKHMKQDWEQVKEICVGRGCKKLLAVNEAEDIKWYKFLGHFGFKDYTLTRVYHQEV